MTAEVVNIRDYQSKRAIQRAHKALDALEEHLTLEQHAALSVFGFPNRLHPTGPGVTLGPLGGLTPPVVHTFDAETKDMLRQALKLLDRIDKKLGDVECLDAAKAEMLKALDLDPNNISGG